MSQQVAEHRVLGMLKKLTPPELKETANGFDPEDGSPLPAVVLGVPRDRFIQLARFLLVNPNGAIGESAPPPPAPASSSKMPLIVGGTALVLGVCWWLSRRGPK